MRKFTKISNKTKICESISTKNNKITNISNSVSIKPPWRVTCMNPPSLANKGKLPSSLRLSDAADPARTTLPQTSLLCHSQNQLP